MNTSVDDLFDHIDHVIQLAKAIFEENASCALYFELWGKFDISTSELSAVEKYLAKLDHLIPQIAIFEKKIYTITISKPWDIVHGNVVKPTKIKEEDLVCTIQDLTPVKK